MKFARAAEKTLKSLPDATSDEKLRNLISDFEKWDGMLNVDSRIAPVVVQMRSAFRQRILNAALGADLAKNYNWPESDVFIDQIVTEQPKEWLPKESATYADLFKASYEDARQSLIKTLQADES